MMLTQFWGKFNEIMSITRRIYRYVWEVFGKCSKVESVLQRAVWFREVSEISFTNVRVDASYFVAKLGLFFRGRENTSPLPF